MSQLRVVITGGSRGIGRAIALRFAREGAQVVVLARTAADLDAVVKEIEEAGGQGFPGQMNLQDVGDIGAAMWRAAQSTGEVFDVLVNCAGAFAIKPIDQMDETLWNRMIEVNLSGPYHVIRESLEYLEGGNRPHIFNVASIGAKQGFPGNTAYCASKYGLRGFSDALRLDLAERGIRVSTVYPGQTDTDIWKDVEGDWDRSKMGKPEDVAEVIWNAYHAPEGADVDDLEVPQPV